MSRIPAEPMTPLVVVGAHMLGGPLNPALLALGARFLRVIRTAPVYRMIALPAMKAHGVPWLLRHLAGEITPAEATEGGKRDTRRYTKRQATWFRNQLPDWMWVAPEEAERVVRDALK